MIGKTIKKLKVSYPGLIISSVPQKPTSMAKVLCGPIELLRMSFEKIVMKSGLTKNKLVASARGI